MEQAGKPVHKKLIENGATSQYESTFRLQGDNTNIENNDITNANTSDALTWGGIPLQDSSLCGGSALGTVDMLSNLVVAKK